MDSQVDVERQVKTSSVAILDAFTKVWCYDREALGKGSLEMRCSKCTFNDSGLCSIRKFAGINNKYHDYPLKNFGCYD